MEAAGSSRCGLVAERQDASHPRRDDYSAAILKASVNEGPQLQPLPIIRELAASDSISDLTALIRRAYKSLADLGLNYTGSYQDDQTTRERICGAECYVLEVGARLAG